MIDGSVSRLREQITKLASKLDEQRTLLRFAQECLDDYEITGSVSSVQEAMKLYGEVSRELGSAESADSPRLQG